MCDGSLVCRDCGLKEMDRQGSCWRCGELVIKSVEHLREDDNLRMVVEEFKKGGGVNPALLQGLRCAYL